MIWFPLFINDKKIATVSALRIDGGNLPDDWNTYSYEVVEEGTTNGYVHCQGTLSHRYGDGGLELMRKILTKVEGERFE